MNLKKQLKLLIEYRGLTAAELSRKSGVSKQVLSLWLSGVKPKNIDQVKRVADSLQVSVDHLLFENGLPIRERTEHGLDTILGNEWISGQFEIKIRRIGKRSIE